jgi:hypothetical protein
MKLTSRQAANQTDYRCFLRPGRVEEPPNPPQAKLQLPTPFLDNNRGEVEENAVAKEKLVKRSIRGKQKRSVKRTEKRELRGEDN